MFIIKGWYNGSEMKTEILFPFSIFHFIKTSIEISRIVVFIILGIFLYNNITCVYDVVLLLSSFFKDF